MRSFSQLSIRVHHTQHFFSILRLADEALSAAVRAKDKTTSEATAAFLRVQEEMKLFGSLPPGVAPARHRIRCPDLSTAMEDASKRDKDKMNFISKVTSFFSTPVSPSHLSWSDDPTVHNGNQDSKGDRKKVNFVVPKSPHERQQNQLIVHRQYYP